MLTKVDVICSLLLVIIGIVGLILQVINHK